MTTGDNYDGQNRQVEGQGLNENMHNPYLSLLNFQQMKICWQFWPHYRRLPFLLLMWGLAQLSGTLFIPTNEAFKILGGDRINETISADLERWRTLNTYPDKKYIIFFSSLSISLFLCSHPEFVCPFFQHSLSNLLLILISFLLLLLLSLLILLLAITLLLLPILLQDPWPPLPGADPADWWHQDPPASGRLRGQQSLQNLLAVTNL